MLVAWPDLAGVPGLGRPLLPRSQVLRVSVLDSVGAAVDLTSQSSLVRQEQVVQADNSWGQLGVWAEYSSWNSRRPLLIFSGKILSRSWRPG